ncbi:carboxymuconolactone decarboxylase family protein [Phytomonospora sp. NPDC050363]|uniref:carboxymuconolactone decarboxylase family protein n=1 Tax=Phytomonospora sp. NPDC050363 TaxID=3155642 RepID=UPI0033F20071
MSDRYARGARQLSELGGGIVHEALDSLHDVAPDLKRLIVEFAYGDMYPRPGLAPRQRQLATIATLTAIGGCEPQLEIHVQLALNVGMSPAEIVETVMHASSYVGFPRVLNAMGVVRKVFEERGLFPVAAGVPRSRGAGE